MPHPLKTVMSRFNPIGLSQWELGYSKLKTPLDTPFQKASAAWSFEFDSTINP